MIFKNYYSRESELCFVRQNNYKVPIKFCQLQVLESFFDKPGPLSPSKWSLCTLHWEILLPFSQIFSFWTEKVVGKTLQAPGCTYTWHLIPIVSEEHNGMRQTLKEWYM